MRKTFLFLLISIFILNFNTIFAQGVKESNFNCFSILVGKKATMDGSVLFAHNEDDYKATIVNWYKVPQITHKPTEEIQLKRGGLLKQAKKTYGFLWLEMPGFEFSDSYMNEWGVTIASNQCSSNETNGEVVDGGIGYYLRRIMAERAKTAKQAVKIAGKIIEKVGYASSGRSYCVADAHEAWILAAVKGKHWVAERVPDDNVAIIPNYYTIGEINLQDTLNFLGSADIVNYAIKKGWYDPNLGKPFNFRKAYGDPVSLANYSNIARHWAAINLLSARHYDFHDTFPFSFKPKSKISLQDLMAVLRNHYEGTQLEMNPAYNHGNPHKNVIMRICSETNRYGMVAQLRSWLPADIGNVLWIAPRRPCVQPFVPWYWGITKIPAAYTHGDFKTALKEHFTPNIQIKEFTPNHAYWTFTHFASKIDSNYGMQIKSIRKQKAAFQNNEFKNQMKFEKKVLKVYANDPSKARLMVTMYTTKLAEKALMMTREKISSR